LNIKGYYVEKKQAGSDFWVKAHNAPILNTMIELTDLLENSEYDFRVRAVNKAGESEPSLSTGKVRITEYPGS
jgi:titin